jgi:pimeloyl-ACP methyl ester carboxylesterase
MTDLPPLPLSPRITSRIIDTSPTSLSFHILESGAPTPNTPSTKPLILLLHGFPELAYSWRRMIPLLSSAGYHVVAVDQRGYGRTTGWDNRPYDSVDLKNFSVLNLVRDIVVLVNALGYKTVRCLCGHDFGAVSAALCALTRPDMFQSLALMSHPFKGSPKLPFNTANSPVPPQISKDDIHTALASLPEPRKHYKWYYSTAPANSELTFPTSSLHTFLREYFHLKSADWSGNAPYPLSGWTAPELAKMPYYYIMPLSSGMRASVSAHMSTENPQTVTSRCKRWLPDEELAVYVSEYTRTTFQGGLNWYRVQTNPSNLKDLDMFAGKKIEVPTKFISGEKDWGTYQEPGAVENMGNVCADFRGTHIVEGAGHWVNSEQPEAVVKIVLELIGGLGTEAVL